MELHLNQSVSLTSPLSLTAVSVTCFLVFRTLNCMIGQMKHILATEQKKTDFKPEDENNVMIQYTTVRTCTLSCTL